MCGRDVTPRMFFVWLFFDIVAVIFVMTFRNYLQGKAHKIAFETK